MTIDDQRRVGFAGRWRSADGAVHTIRQDGDDLRIDSETENGSSLHGRGVVFEGTALIEVVDVFGNQSRLELSLEYDGAELGGRQTGPMGVSVIRLTRHD